MKKINDKKLLFFSNYPLKLTIMTKLCVLLLICMVTTVTAGAVSPSAANSALAGYSISGPEDDQQTTVTGTLTDASTGEALAGVTVLVKGTTTGTQTDANGKFSIKIPDREAVLVFSFIGYTTQEIRVQQGSVVNLKLASEEQKIDEIVVVGYGTQKKESVVGAITQVNNATLMQAGATNVTNAIAGKLSGVLTIQQRGEPGNNAADIYVRGISSWNGSAPLVLVDGVERDFTLIDPNEINTISVLKDASATAVFGARGANGVIVVTTKRGAIGKPHMDFNGSYGYQVPTRLPDYIDSRTTMEMYNVAIMNNQQFNTLIPQWQLDQYSNPSSDIMKLRFPNVDWFDICAKKAAPMATANMNVSGGTEFAKYFLSFGYQYNGTMFEQTKQEFYDMRYFNHLFNYRINLDFNITKSTILSLNVGGSLNLKNNPNSSPWRDFFSTSGSRFPAYFPDWVLDQIPDLAYPNASGNRLQNGFGEYTGNPYNTLNYGQFNKDLGSRLFTDLILNQDLGFLLKGLKVMGKFSVSSTFNNRQLTANPTFPQYQIDYNKVGVDILDNATGLPKPGGDGKVDSNPWTRMSPAEGAEYWETPPIDINVGGLNSYSSDYYYEVSLNYANTFGKHSVSGLGLFNRQQKNNGAQFPYFNEGLVGRATYDYDKKYLFEVNIGYTGSERFAPENRFGFFPSMAVGWVPSEEQFFKNAVPWMNRLKLRYSDGYVGSDYARSRWLYTSSFFKDDRGYIREDYIANPVAQWERAHKKDIGFEMGLFKNLITLNVDLFDEYRDNMLLAPKSTTFLIGNGFKELNLGKVKKHGIEVELEYRKSIGSNFTYFVKGIFGFNESRVIFKDDPPNNPEHMKLAGKPLTEMLSSEYGLEGLEINGVELTGTGYYTSIDDIHNNVSPVDITRLYVGDYKFLDYMVDGTVNAFDKYPIPGLTYPPITYSFSGGFTWKGFDFNFMFAGNQGKYVQYNQGFEVEFIKGDWRVHKSQLDYWTPTNQDAGHATMHYSGSSSQDNLVWGGGEADRGYQTIIKDRFFRNASYLRLKDLYVGYTIKNVGGLSRGLGISNIMVYASGSNIFTITPLIEGDPEATNFQQGYYPQMASYRLGMKLIF
jgi:TonB-linked SusC/RagA family outer membrane protein